ncbi:MAG: RNA polymerase sigma factor [Candidatus Kapabacteria bacterium]|nr:RNA polymerase sigma factor [Candidatus Kapabacteria bacterium]
MQINFEKYNDSELCAFLCKGNADAERAFAELYRRHSPRIYAYCRRFLGNPQEAKDVFQEAFVRFYQSTKQENRDFTNVPGFLLTITRNLCFNSKRKERDEICFEDYMYYESDDRNEKEELLNLIKMALEVIPDEYRDIFILREYNELSYLEIAELTKTSISNVKVKIHRAKQKIREILQPYLKEKLFDDSKNYYEKPL